ncbi:diguanylate cyclase [Psychromonas sp. KJ10-10]|uniref:diguanylate cyclase n=1 Tax=Psychromonas sp. KJ10-10 TaxID=3391823 RepID=UPI0039B500A2
MKLKVKLPLILVPLLIAPILLISALSFESMRNNSKESLLAQMNSLINQIKDNEQAIEQTLKANSMLFSGTSLLKNYLFTAEEDRYRFALLPLLNLFANYHNAYPDYEEICVVLPDGYEDSCFISEVGKNRIENSASSDWFNQISQNKMTSMTSFEWDESSKEPIMLVAQRLMFVDPTKEDSTVMPPSHRGYLLISTSLKRLQRQIQNTTIGKMGGVLIIDKQGKPLYAQSQKIHFNDNKQLPKVARLAIETQSTQTIEVDNNKLMLRATQLPGGLTLVGYLPEVELIEAGTSLRHTILIVGIILVLLFSGLLMLFLQFLIVKPLNKLGEGAEAIGSGKFDTRMTFKQRDEVALLASQFNHMANGLMESRRLKDEAQAESLKLKETAIASLKAADKLKDEFLANTSHELRTPLHGIIGLAESLQKGVAGPISNSMRDNLALITASGQRLSNLVNDILDFSKLKHQSLKLALHPIDLHGASDLVLSMIRVIAEPKGLRIENRVAVDFPAAMADESRLYQILYNLVGNAVKFTTKGHVAVSAFIDNNDMICIQVEDSGIGIPETEIDTIFRSFEQLDSGLERGGTGTGLGLAITKKLIESHGGSIEVSARQGGGTIFSFTLPKASINQRDEDISNAMPNSINDQTSDLIDNQANLEDGATDLVLLENVDKHLSYDEKPHILVVDDELVNLRVIENYLSINGYCVSTASSSFEGLEKIATKGQHFDLILLDVMMPNESGFTMCEKLRKNYSTENLPVIFLTALTREGDLKRGFEVGGNDYIPKPFGYAELLARIHLHLSLSQQSRHLRDMNLELEKRVKQRTEALERAYDDMELLANLDGLTGVNNRRSLDSYIGKAFQKTKNNNAFFSCAMIDIDYFKAFNDHYGHQEGDVCLATVAQNLRLVAEKHCGFLARYGGEEFCLCFDLPLTETFTIIQKACSDIESLGIVHLGSDKGTVTISAGVASVSETIHSATVLIAEADKALYKAKGAGRNCVKVNNELVSI